MYRIDILQTFTIMLLQGIQVKSRWREIGGFEAILLLLKQFKNQLNCTMEEKWTLFDSIVSCITAALSNYPFNRSYLWNTLRWQEILGLLRESGIYDSPKARLAWKRFMDIAFERVPDIPYFRFENHIHSIFGHLGATGSSENRLKRVIQINEHEISSEDIISSASVYQSMLSKSANAVSLPSNSCLSDSSLSNSCIQNPEVLLILISLIRKLSIPDIIQELKSLLELFVGKDTENHLLRNMEVLSKSGFLQLVLETFDDILNVESSKKGAVHSSLMFDLKDILLEIAHSICAYRPSSLELKGVLNVGSKSSYRWIMHMLAAYPQSSSFWECELMSRGNAGISVPTIPNIFNSSNGFSVSIWIRIVKCSTNPMPVPLFEIYRKRKADKIRLVACIQPSGIIRISNAHSEFVDFSTLKPILQGEWYHFVISKSSGRNSKLLTLTINGSQSESKTFNFGLPISSKPFRDSSASMIIGQDGDTSERNRVGLIWWIGALMVTSESLEAEQIKSLYEKSHDYPGTLPPERFQFSLSESSSILDPLEDHKRKTVSIDPKSVIFAFHPSRVFGLELFSLEKTGIFLSDKLSELNSLWIEVSQKDPGLIVTNSSWLDGNHTTPIGILTGGITRIDIKNIADSLRMLGGPALFFPSIANAHSAQLLEHSLTLFGSLISSNKKNRDEITRIFGYEILAHCLISSPFCEKLSSSVLDVLFAIAEGQDLLDFKFENIHTQDQTMSWVKKARSATILPKGRLHEAIYCRTNQMNLQNNHSYKGIILNPEFVKHVLVSVRFWKKCNFSMLEQVFNKIFDWIRVSPSVVEILGIESASTVGCRPFRGYNGYQIIQIGIIAEILQFLIAADIPPNLVPIIGHLFRVLIDEGIPFRDLESISSFLVLGVGIDSPQGINVPNSSLKVPADSMIDESHVVGTNIRSGYLRLHIDNSEINSALSQVISDRYSPQIAIARQLFDALADFVLRETQTEYTPATPNSASHKMDKELHLNDALSIFSPYWFFLFIWGEVHPIVTVSAMKLLLVLRLRVSSFESTFKGIPGDGALASELEFISPSKELICIVWQMILRNLLDDDLETLHSSMIKFQNISVQSLELLRSVLFLSCRYLAESTEQSARSTIKCSLDIFLTILRVSTDDLSPIVQIETVCALLPLAKFDELKCTVRNILSEIFYQALFSSMQVEPVLLLQLLGMHLLASFKELDSTVDYLASILQSLAEICGDESRRRSMIFNENTWTKIKYVSRALYEAIETTKESIFFHSFILSATKFFFEILHLLSTLLDVSHEHFTFVEVVDCYGFCCGSLHRILIWYFHEFASCVDELSKLLDLMLQHGSLIFHAPRTEEENFIPLFCFHSIRILVLAPKSSLLESLIGSCWNLMLTKKKNILLEKCFPISFRFHPKTLEKVSADAREALCDGSKNSPQDFISSHCDQLLAVLAQTCDGYWSLFIAQRKNLKRLESDSFQNTRPSPIVASNFQTRLDNLRHDLAPKIQIIEQIRQTKRRQREFYEEQRSSRLWRRLDRNLSLESPVSFVKRSLPPDRWKLDTVEDYLGQRKKLARCEEFYDVFNISPDEILKHQNKNLDVSRRPPPALKSTGDFSLTSGRPLAFSVHSSKPFGMFTEDNIVEYSDEIEGAQDSSHGILAAEVDEDSDDDQLDDEDHLGSSSPLSEADTKVREDEMILRLLAPGDRILTKNAFFNCKRVTGLDPCDAILVMCISSVYVVDNFHLSDSGDIEEIKDYKASWRFLTELVPSGSDLLLRVCSRAENSSVPLIDDDIHSARQILYGQIRQVFRRRFSLQNVALEIYLFDGSSHLLVFSSRDERELFIGRLRRLNVCESAFNEQIQQKGMMQRWQSGELSNFAYLMYLNRHAGRTYNDLTQYPVFPWILSDYRSSRLNLSDPSIYRDLSKPMGALGASRSSKFRAQYEQWSDPSTPAWHYGSHYSSSAIVIGYLLRLEPFARIACELQSGQFDKADRLFKDVELAWRQASELGSQDVRELIPEFFCLSAFLENQNNFDLGETQRGHRVDHIKLPAWSYGDSERFIRLHRAALESEYVSANLHAWIDLIFGFKQMGPASIAAQNVFHFATYEQNVDVESIPDPVEKQAMICMIQNFGQTPRQLFKKAHPRRRLGRAPPCVTLDARSIEYRIIRQIDGPVSGIYHTREDRPPLAISGQSLLIGPKYRKLIRWGFPDCGIRFFQFLSTPRHPVNQLRGSYEGLHDSPLTRLAVTEDGRYLVSGSEDGVISLWCLSTRSSHSSLSLWRRWTAHVAPIEGLAASSAHSLVVSSSSDGVVVLWDLARGQLLRRLDKFDSLVSCVSIVEKTGDVIVASGAEISIWTMNGKCIIRERLVSIEEEQSEDLSITAVGMTSEPDWISVWNAVITGFADGSVAIWQIVDNPFPEDRHMHIKNGKIIRQSELSRNIQLETQDKFPRPSLGLRLESWVRAHNSPVTSIGTSTHVLRRMWSGDSDGSVIQWEVSALGDTLSGPKLVRNYCAVCRQEFLEARKLRRICPACNLFVCEGCGETVLEQEKRRWNCRACIVNSKQKDNKG